MDAMKIALVHTLWCASKEFNWWKRVPVGKKLWIPISVPATFKEDYSKVEIAAPYHQSNEAVGEETLNFSVCFPPDIRNIRKWRRKKEGRYWQMFYNLNE